MPTENGSFSEVEKAPEYGENCESIRIFARYALDFGDSYARLENDSIAVDAGVCRFFRQSR